MSPRVSPTPPLRLSSVPLLPMLVTVVCTIALCGWLEESLLYLFIPVTGIIVAIAFGLWQRRFGAIQVVGLTVAIAWVSCELNFPSLPPEDFRGVPTVYSGYVSERVEGARSLNASVRVDAIYDKGTHSMKAINPFMCYVVNPTREPDMQPGDRITFKTELTEFQTGTDIPHEHDFSAYQWRKGIRTLGVVIKSDVIVDQHPDKVPLIIRIRKLNNSFAESVETKLTEAGLNWEATNFFTTMITGRSPAGMSEMRGDFSAVGMSHILAVSGMHVGILIGLAGVVLFPLVLLDRKRLIRNSIILIIIWIYAICTGLSPSVVRAVVMATVLIIAGMTRRTSSSLNNLCLAGILILIFDPLALWAPGFQFSFLAVASIILLVPMSELSGSKVGRSVSGAATTIAAVLGTGALSAYYFHTFPTYFLLANIPILTILPWIFSGGVVLLLGAVVGLEIHWLAEGLNYVMTLITNYIKWLAELPGSVIDNIYFPYWYLIPYFIALAITVWTIMRRNEKTVILSALAWSGCIMLWITNDSKSYESVWTLQRDRQTTQLIVRIPGRFIMTGTAESKGKERDNMTKAYARYEDYLRCNEIDSIEWIRSGYRDETMLRTRDELFIGNQSVVLLNRRNYQVTKRGIDYLIICKGFRGDILKAIQDYDPRHVVLSLDIGPKRMIELQSTLETVGIPYHSMRDGSLTVRIE